MSSKYHQYSIQIPRIQVIYSIHQLKEGTEIVVEIASKKHHAVVTDVSHRENTFEVIHLTCVDDKHCRADCQKLMMKFQSENYSTYDYGAFSVQRKLNVDGNVVKLRACILYKIFHTIKDLKYDRNEFNCDHFASYCIAGSAYSKLLQTPNEVATETLDRK